MTERSWNDPSEAPGSAGVRLRRVCVRPADGSPRDRITLDTPFLIEIEYWNLHAGARFDLTLNVTNESGILIFRTAAVTQNAAPLPRGLSDSFAMSARCRLIFESPEFTGLSCWSPVIT